MSRFILFLFLFGQIVNAQELTNNKIKNALKKFHPEKTIILHIHSNKNTYVSDEKIWFSIYAFEKENSKINLNNNNLVVQLTNAENKIISKSLLYLNNGQANGNFALNPENKTDTYYLKAFIPNNLERTTFFTKAIKIINSSSPLPKNAVSHTEKLDVQILPEGGYLVSNVKNSCGLKILNSYGKGIKLRNLILEDDKGIVIENNIATNDLGMGKLSFLPKEERSYFLRSKSMNFKKELPKVYQKGIALKLEQNFKNGELQIELNTNKKSLSSYSNQNITIAIHKESLVNSYTTKFDKDYTKLVLNIPSHKLFPGTNTITVFDKDFKPLVERLFFNFQSIKDNSSFISQTSNRKDTLTFSIINKVNSTTVKTQTSISVLPSKTIANNYRDHLFASVYLKPFLNGTIENPSYYFQKNNNQKRFELDLLLLNQGWSKYKWDRVFKPKTPRKQLKNNTGLTISGYIVPLDKEESAQNILLYSKTNEDIKMTPVKDNTFKIENLIFKTGSEFEFSALNNSGKPIKANFFFTVKPSISVLNHEVDLNIINPFPETNLTQNIIEKFDGEVLDEVIIKGNSLKFDKFTRDRFGIKVDSSLYVYNTIENYFRSKEGLRLVYHEGAGSDPDGYYWTYTDGAKAIFIVNGQRATNINGLLRVSMEHVLELYHGGRARRGIRNSHLVFTNGKELELPENLKTSKSFEIKNGFTIQKETYIPKYINYESETYQKFASVAWEPNVKTNSNGFNKISLINPGKHNLLFYIEGYTETGEPFSTITSYEKNVIK